jgi:hypothetical protein
MGPVFAFSDTPSSPEFLSPSFHLSPKERGHTYTPDNGGAVRLVAAQEMKQSKSVGMLERELGA